MDACPAPALLPYLTSLKPASLLHASQRSLPWWHSGMHGSAKLISPAAANSRKRVTENEHLNRCWSVTYLQGETRGVYGGRGGGDSMSVRCLF
jgi:hypothetical protein